MMIIDLWLYDYYIILIICIIWLELIMCFYFSLCNDISRRNIPDRNIKVNICKRFMEFWYSLVIGMKSDSKHYINSDSVNETLPKLYACSCLWSFEREAACCLDALECEAPPTILWSSPCCLDIYIHIYIYIHKPVIDRYSAAIGYSEHSVHLYTSWFWVEDKHSLNTVNKLYLYW